ncbi:hypothetical protein VDBG_04509 [Verticillium alfalfae VaMs.102]|uniref:Uncharacterized protein n=1 Tax=Verticillium alfalfae (strain VaMs.102 / ATCC MYA-4576 / FGSC 10136) TaxID=526221 RepID=C9SHH7_VERA1|nr:hypothetical protein VDBG_04509 [Verticillium alfalfae VaMs.102]EEY18400.1 hypothetical protein VDBG_04509 [Verticillium alfalfae VaMs.102]
MGQTNQANQGDAIATSGFIGPNAGHAYALTGLLLPCFDEVEPPASQSTMSRPSTNCLPTPGKMIGKKRQVRLAGARLDDRPLEGVQDGWGPQVSETRCMSWHVAASICRCWVSEPRALQTKQINPYLLTGAQRRRNQAASGEG